MAQKMMTRFVRSALCILLTLSAFTSGNHAAHRDAQSRRATKRSMMSMSKKASKTKKGRKSSKGGSGNSNGIVGGVGASPNCVTPPQNCNSGKTCVADFATLRSNTQAGISTVLCKYAPITTTQRIIIPHNADVKISCCDQCDYGCKIQLGGRDNPGMFGGGGGYGTFALDGVELNGNGFTGWAIDIAGFSVTLSNALVTGFNGLGSVIVLWGGMLSVADTSIEDNDSSHGVIYLNQASGTFVRTKILDNFSSDDCKGGAVTVNPYGGRGDVTFLNSEFSYNYARGDPSANDVFVMNSAAGTVRCDSATETQSNDGGGVVTGGAFPDQCPL